MTDDLDPVSPVPRYRQVAAIIRARIESGELQPGQPIPSQNTIMQTWGVARMTAHKALGVLVDEGIVVVVPGVGALVARPKALADHAHVLTRRLGRQGCPCAGFRLARRTRHDLTCQDMTGRDDIPPHLRGVSLAKATLMINIGFNRQ